MIEILFWWTGFVVWAVAAALLFLCGLPDGEVVTGVTRLTFYGFGPVLWRVLPENINTLNRLKANGYHFLPLAGGLLLGLSLPTWLSRRLFGGAE